MYLGWNVTGLINLLSQKLPAVLADLGLFRCQFVVIQKLSSSWTETQNYRCGCDCQRFLAFLREKKKRARAFSPLRMLNPESSSVSLVASRCAFSICDFRVHREFYSHCPRRHVSAPSTSSTHRRQQPKSVMSDTDTPNRNFAKI